MNIAFLRSLFFLAFALSCIVAGTVAVADDNWTRLHGTRGIGVADGKLPNQWQPSDYRWQVDLLGDDAGSATVFGDRVFVASSDSTALRRLSCIQLSTGKVMWEHDFPSPTSHLHRRNAYATCTPTCDAQHVYFAYANDEQTILVCMTHEGRQVWQRDLGRWVSQHGFGTSPALVDELVVLFKSQQAAKLAPGVQPGQSKMIAMHRETGKTVWETPLQATNVCYGIPAVHRAADGTTQIIAANTGNGMFGLNAADGTMMWSVPAFDKRCVSCPLIVQTRGNTLVLATTGSGGGGNRLAAVRPGVSGRDAELVYEINKSVGYVPTSAVLYSPTDRAPLLFMISDRGIATCSNALTGQNVWTRRIGGDFGASPIIIGDKLLLVSLSGQAHVLRAADKFESLGEFDLGGKSGASPAVAGGQLVLRIADKLCCLDIGE